MKLFAARASLLLATSSAAALLAGSSGPVLAACGNVVTPPFTNPSGPPVSCVIVSGSSVSGGVTNSGTISPGGPTGILITVSTFNGGVANSGTISAGQNGILAADVAIFGSTGAGGITNSGTITADPGGGHTPALAATDNGILLNTVSTFSGGISNNGGTIVAGNNGILIVNVAAFSGGVSNGGTISGGGSGILIQSVSTFVGGITNSGRISAAATYGIAVVEGATFSGGITNSGTITAPRSVGIQIGLVGSAAGQSTFLGGIVNSGTISAQTGIVVAGGATYSGAVVNSGTISGTGGTAIDVSAAPNAMAIDQRGGTITGDIRLSAYADVLNVAGGVINGNILGAGSSDAVTFALGPGGTFGYAGTISGVHAVNIDSGTVTLRGTIAPTALTIASPGTLIVGNNGSIAGNVTDNGTFAIDRSDSYAFAGNISGSGSFVQMGSGATVLTGVNTYGGGTTVAAGALLVNGSIGSSSLTTVYSGAMLGGTGTVGATRILSGGTLAPGPGGSAAGMLTIGGNLTFQPGGLYLVQVNPASASLASVTANGTASLSGTVQAVFSPGRYLPRSYDILSSARRSGTFAALTTVDLPAGFAASLSYTATDVLLDLTAALGAGWLDVNQHNVANAINGYFNNGGTLPPGFLKVFGLTSGLGTALSELSGEAATGAQAGAFQMMSSFMSLLLDPYAQNRGGGFGQATGFAPKRGALPADVAGAYASVLKAPPVAAPTFNVWAAGFGGTNRTSGDPVVGSHDTTTHAAGSAAGVDYRPSPDTLLGFALAGDASSWSLSDGLGGGHSDAFQAGAYGIRQIGSAYVAGALAFAEYWASTSRTVTVAGTDTLAAAFDAQSYGFRLESGTRIPATPFALTPYGALQAQRFDAPAHGESATSGSSQFALSYAAQTATQTRAELGSWADRTFVLADGNGVSIFARAAWAHDWQSAPFLGAAFLGLPAAGFVVNGAVPPNDLALVTAGAELRLHNGWSLLGKLDGELGKGAQTCTGTGQLRYTW